MIDLDHTLLSGDSDVLWCEYPMAEGLLRRAEFKARNAVFARRCAEGSAAAAELCNVYGARFAGETLAQRRPWRERFLREVVAPRIPASARALVEQRPRRGDPLVLTTATHRAPTDLTARHLGIAEPSATEVEVFEGV